jgi:hypothetical protein
MPAELEAAVAGAAIGKRDSLVIVAMEDKCRRLALLDDGQRRAAVEGGAIADFVALEKNLAGPGDVG